MTLVQIIYFTDPLKWDLTKKVGLQRIILIIFQLTTTEAMSSYEGRFINIGGVLTTSFISKTKSVAPHSQPIIWL